MGGMGIGKSEQQIWGRYLSDFWEDRRYRLTRPLRPLQVLRSELRDVSVKGMDVGKGQVTASVAVIGAVEAEG